jgi:GH43 family beta-xylosidase
MNGSHAALNWTNPLVEQRADPHMLLHGGRYWFTASVPSFDGIELRSASTLEGLRSARPRMVWRRHAQGPMSWHVWAPELHRIDGRWFIYFAASERDSIWQLRMYVLELQGDDPLEGPWVERGEIVSPLAAAGQSFALDATTFAHRGQRYLVWAQRDPAIHGNTNLYIAPLANPWTLGGPPVMLSRPDLPWERVGFLVNEGPAVLHRQGRVFISYSASATDANYCMGLLWADENADLLNAGHWTKSAQPVFASAMANGQFGPGHNSFTTTPDGQVDLLVYHARNYERIEGDPLKDANRHTRVQPFAWNESGMPMFGQPLPDGSCEVFVERAAQPPH